MSNMIPGSAALGRGFNIFGRYDESSLLLPLFDTSSPDGKVSVGSQQFDVSANTLVDTAVSQATGDAYSFDSRHAYQQHFSVKAGVEFSFGGFSAEASAAFSDESTSDTENEFASYEALIEKWSLSLKDSSVSSLSPSVLNNPDFKAIPATFNPGNAYLFFRFFQKYGTHFVASVKVGGRIYYTASIEKSHTTSEQDTEVRISAEYSATFTVKGSVDTEWGKAGQDWFNNRRVKILSVGGSADLVESLIPEYDKGFNDLYEKWIASLDEQPAAIDFTLQNVSNLFSGDQADAVNAAYAAYANQYLYLESARNYNTVQLSGRELDANDPLQNNFIDSGSQPDDLVCIGHALVLNRRTLEVVLNKRFAPPPVVEWDAPDSPQDFFADIYAALQPWEGHSDFLLVYLTQNQYAGVPPKGNFYNLLKSAGAGEGLDTWINTMGFYSGGMPYGEVNYIFVGVMGSGPGKGLEQFTYPRFPQSGITPAEMAKMWVFLSPSHLDDGTIEYTPLQA